MYSHPAPIGGMCDPTRCRLFILYATGVIILSTGLDISRRVAILGEKGVGEVSRWLPWCPYLVQASDYYHSSKTVIIIKGWEKETNATPKLLLVLPG